MRQNVSFNYRKSKTQYQLFKYKKKVFILKTYAQRENTKICSYANDTEWQNVIWTDENKFNLDGSDGFSYFEKMWDVRSNETQTVFAEATI